MRMRMCVCVRVRMRMCVCVRVRMRMCVRVRVRVRHLSAFGVATFALLLLFLRLLYY